MDIKCMTSSSSLITPKIILMKNTTIVPKWAIIHDRKNRVPQFQDRKYTWCCQWKQKGKPWTTQKIYVTKEGESLMQVKEEEPAKKDGTNGTIGGAVALIIGTSIGSGILALPQKASPAGVLPSSISLIICWVFLLIEALLIIEINVCLRRKKRMMEEESELEVISLRTMAQETLGNWGGTLATVTYVFLGYTSMIAYSSKSGEILFHLINLPESVSGILFTGIFTILISVGGTQATDQVNQWLTISMIGLLIAIEVLAVVYGGWSGLEGSGDWGKVPATIPVMIFSLVYHDILPVLCAYLGSDLARLRASVLIGVLVPLLALLVWDAIALSLSAQGGQITDPVELLMGVKWGGYSFMVEAFSLLAVGTSMIGSLLGFSEFFKEQLKNLSMNSSLIQITQMTPHKSSGLRNWWGRNKTTFKAMAMVITPTLLVSTTVPDAFSTATDIAGGYCMTVLYGILPPAMAWAMQNREAEDDFGQKALLTRAKPAVFGVGVFACGIVVEQILQDFLALQF